METILSTSARPSTELAGTHRPPMTGSAPHKDVPPIRFPGAQVEPTSIYEYALWYHRLGFNTSDTSFAATFFGLTGLHGVHVFIGLVILTVMCIRAFRGHFSPEHHHGIEVGGIYWHFVDVMWIVVYVTVYIL